LAGVDPDHFAGDHARRVGQEEQDRIRNILGVASSGRTASAFALSTNSGGSVRAMSVMTMPGRRRSPDPLGTQFPRQGLRQPDQAALEAQ